MVESKISNENSVDIERGNLNFFSKRLEKGKNKSANKSARKKGASMLCPNFTRYPMPMMLMITKANFEIKGSESVFIEFNFR